MFIGHFLYQGWLQIYIIQTRIFGICDVEIDGNSVVMCSWHLIIFHTFSPSFRLIWELALLTIVLV
jgi:hypothetical protein